MENTPFEDVLIRSRITILDMMEQRGYETGPYRKITAGDLVKLHSGPDTDSLRIDIVHKEDPERKAIILYMLDNIKQRVGSGDIVNKLLASTDEPATGKYASGGIDPKTTEVIIIYKMLDKMSAENTESYDKAALEAWAKNKFKIQFFPITRLVNNPMKHVLQPKFELVSEEQKKIIMKECYARDLSHFPFIKFHNDAVARFMGLVPGQMVKITSASPTAGEYVKYRVCAP